MDEKTTPQSREDAVKEWERESQASLVAKKTNATWTGIGLVAVTVLALGAVWYLRNGQDASANTKGEPKEIEIASRKPVPELPVESVPPQAPPQTEVPAQVVDQQAEQAKLQRAELERRMQEARLKSALLAQNGSTANQTQPSVPPGAAGVPASLLGGNPEKGAQDINSKFSRSVSGQGVAVSQARQLTNLEYKILQGKLIEAVLEPRAISDLPGMVCAVVQRDVYAHTGRAKLIPWGSKVCGVYSGDLKKGQERLFVVWNTLRRPDGVEVSLDSIGADQLGSAGMGGQVNTRFAEIFGMSALLSIIGAGASTVGVQTGDQYNSEAYYRQSVQQAAAQTAQTVLHPYVNIQPTVTVPAGSKVRIYVNRDLDFSAVEEAKSTANNQPHYIF